MFRGLNKAVLVGHVGARPEVRTTQSGTRVATFSVATNHPDTGGSGERTDWHRVVAWPPLADLVERFVGRGDRVYVEGRLEYRARPSRDQRGGPIAEIVAQDLIVLAGASARGEPTTMGKERFAS